jgi:hypothetical protein
MHALLPTRITGFCCSNTITQLHGSAQTDRDTFTVPERIGLPKEPSDMRIPEFTAEAGLQSRLMTYRVTAIGVGANYAVPAQGFDDVNGCYDACATLALEASGGDIAIAEYYYNTCRAGCNDVFLRRGRIRS